ncbi:EAL domain-containing protein [Pragia fontium]|uniref:Diguanylate cyclase (GGDEF) domain-containing protein n=1 Tax=Pragia fontium DSM 5563 = ATCC 49100 TaxID=1122977 RepID=A0AAJ5BI11_9GAMM|nr:EAL domain-containing protein [Pragia fontium]SFD16926.1 diguanylate cyclase (GGDEF) domain-containing protein [Pragia fontium DSM 5563 = ATCC 49100]
MLVKRSLTIKQMSLVTIVAVATICIFVVIQMFDFVQQRKQDYLIQLDNIGYSVAEPLERDLWNRNLEEIQNTLDGLIDVGWLSKANLLVNGEIIHLYSFRKSNDRAPTFFASMLGLPISARMPLYSPEYRSTDSKPMGYLILEADSYQLYQASLHKFATVLVTYLLLALMLSIAISWCLNRLLVYPLRAIAEDLRTLPSGVIQYHQLTLPLRHQDDELGMLVRNYNRNQQALAKAHNQLSRLSTRDPVTDLPNYTLFQELLKQQIANSCLTKTSFSLLFINLDSLKDVFQALGPERANQHLVEIIGRIQPVLSHHTVLARLHGEELAILSKFSAAPLQAMQLAKRLVELVELPLDVDEFHLLPELSIGIVQYPNDGEDADELLSHAQSAMLLAQRRGKNQIQFFEPNMTNEVQQRLKMKGEIIRGLKENQFQLYLQPQVDIATGIPCGAEALLRWHYSADEIRYPLEFIPLAEEAELILPLGRWVLEEACSILSRWKQQGISLILSVNLSALQLQQVDLIDQLKALVERYDFEPAKLTLELTETAHIYDLAEVLPTLMKIRELGISIALDDFGTGYSNLNYLRHLPVDELKIDKSFIDGLPEEGELVKIVSSVAQVLSLKLVVEGVETQAQIDWLLAHDIHIAQGYLFSPAIPYKKFQEKYLSDYSEPPTDIL